MFLKRFFLITFPLWILFAALYGNVAVDTAKVKPINQAYPINELHRANVFVTVHMEDKNVKKNVKKIQQKLLDADPKFSSTLQKISTLHITFDIFYLDLRNLPNARKALELAASSTYANFGPLNVTFKGISNFSNEHLISLVNPESKALLTQYHDLTNTIFKSYNLIPQIKLEFQPHMTLANLEKDDQDLKFKWDFLMDKELELGSFAPKKLQLCHILIDPEDTYYPVLLEAYFPE